MAVSWIVWDDRSSGRAIDASSAVCQQGRIRLQRSGADFPTPHDVAVLRLATVVRRGARSQSWFVTSSLRRRGAGSPRRRETLPCSHGSEASMASTAGFRSGRFSRYRIRARVDRFAGGMPFALSSTLNATGYPMIVTKAPVRLRLAASLLCVLASWAAAAESPQDSDRDFDSKPGSEATEALLPWVLVSDWSTQGYLIPRTSTATGTVTPLVDIPQSIQVIPEEVLRDQGVQSLAEATRNSPGIAVNMGEGMRDELIIRGVETKSDFFMDGLRDDTEYMRDLYNVAHVDV